MKLKGNAVFELVLVLLSLIMFIMAGSYNARARVAPEILSAVVFILALVLFLGENIPFFQRRMGFLKDKGFFTQSSGSKHGEETPVAVDAKAQAGDSGIQARSELIKLIRLLLWLVLFVAALRFVNYLITVPVWLLLLIKFEGGRKWRDAVLAGVGMGIFDFVLFAVLLHVSF